MGLIKEFFANRVLFAAVLGWLCAQVLKLIITACMTKKSECGTALGSRRYAERAFGHGLRPDDFGCPVLWGVRPAFRPGG